MYDEHFTIYPARFSVSCETRHSAELGTYRVLKIGEATFFCDRRQLNEIEAAIRANRDDAAAA